MGIPMLKKINKILEPQLKLVEQNTAALAISNKIKLSLYKKSVNTGIPANILEEVYKRGYSIWNRNFKGNPEQFAFDRVNSFIAGGFAADLDKDLREANMDQPTPSVKDISKKFGLSIIKVKKSIKSGSKIEREHTKSQKKAEEIARDHIGENPNYYPKLKKYVESTEKPHSTDKNNPASRFTGSTEATEIYKNDTPGQRMLKIIKKCKNG